MQNRKSFHVANSFVNIWFNNINSTIIKITNTTAINSFITATATTTSAATSIATTTAAAAAGAIIDTIY